VLAMPQRLGETRAQNGIGRNMESKTKLKKLHASERDKHTHKTEAEAALFYHYTCTLSAVRRIQRVAEYSANSKFTHKIAFC